MYQQELKKMPKKMEKVLMKKAKEMGLMGDKKDAYIYGTMRKTGWKPGKEKK